MKFTLSTANSSEDSGLSIPQRFRPNAAFRMPDKPVKSAAAKIAAVLNIFPAGRPEFYIPNLTADHITGWKADDLEPAAVSEFKPADLLIRAIF